MKAEMMAPPSNLAAEQSVVGGIMLDGKAFDSVRDVLSVDDFYHPPHKIIFNAIAAVSAANQPVDVLTIDEYLNKKGLSDNVGGLSYLGTLAKDTPSAANIVAYAKIVREKAVLREIIATAREMSAAAFNADSDVAGIIADAEDRIFKLSQASLRGKRGFIRLRESLRDVVEQMEDDVDSPPKDGITGLPSGFVDLDKMTGGHRGGDLVIIAARPGMGKTAFALNIVDYVATRQGRPVAFFSLEMQREQIAQRILSANSGTPLQHIRSAWKVEEHEWPLITASISRLGDAPVFVDDTPALSIGELRSRVLRLVSEIGNEYQDGLGAIVVDYVQLMSVSQNSDNRNQQIEEITRGLKRLAKELDIPVFALSQLNRKLESRPNKRPVMSDLRDSGGIEQDADLILFLYRDEVYYSDTPDQGIAEVIIDKQRNGPTGTVRLAFQGEFTRFCNLGQYGYGDG